jgi:hypothetical protein
MNFSLEWYDTPPVSGRGKTDRYQSPSTETGTEYVFSLNPGDVGSVQGDSTHDLPCERIEAKSDALKSDSYKVSFDVEFDQMHASQKRTKFFQIHQYEPVQGDKKAWNAALLMLAVDRDRLIVQPCLEERIGTDEHGRIDLGLARCELRDAKFRLDFEISGAGGMIAIALWIQTVGVERCFKFDAFQRPNVNQIKLKFGLYRHLLPAERCEPRAHDKCTFRNISVNGTAISVA